MPDATDAISPAESNRRASVLRVTVKSALELGICEYSVPLLNLAGTMTRDGFVAVLVYKLLNRSYKHPFTAASGASALPAFARLLNEFQICLAGSVSKAKVV
jgi:hypothetical protein